MEYMRSGVLYAVHAIGTSHKNGITVGRDVFCAVHEEAI
jgi:hypothetical protein